MRGTGQDGLLLLRGNCDARKAWCDVESGLLTSSHSNAVMFLRRRKCVGSGALACLVCSLILVQLDGHRNSCRGASFTCLDCMVHFHGTDYRAHTSCISEAQKYQGHLYKGDKKANKGEKRKSSMPGGFPDTTSQAMVPHKHAYVEDAPDGDEMNAITVIDVPPKAPTPPPANEALPPNVNVFDFLVQDAGCGAEQNGLKMAKSTTHSTNGAGHSLQHFYGDGSHYAQNGYSYGHAPVQPTYEHYDSWPNLADSQHSHVLMPPPPYVTPAPKHNKRDNYKLEKSDKKRKRAEDLDLSSAKRPTSRGDDMMVDAQSGSRVLHSGLTGGLSKLVTDPQFYEDRIEAGPTPISPIKRSKRDKERHTSKDDRRKSSYTSYTTTSSKSASSKHGDEKHSLRSRSRDRDSQLSKLRHSKHRRESSSSIEDRRSMSLKAIEYPSRPGSVQPTAKNQLVSYMSRAELFLTFITKGPESERGCSINKVLKRYHRERDVHGEEREEDDKDLWKSLRLKRNDRGEIVLFT